MSGYQSGVQPHPRLGARRRQVAEQRTRRRLRWVLAVMLLAAAGALAWWVAHSPLLAVTDIRVEGMDREAAIGLAGEGGLADGVPIIWVRPGQVEAALRADPWVADARVSIDYPHTVTITARLHDPVAAVKAADGTWLVVTGSGAVVSHGAGPEGRVAITGSALPALRPGTTIGAPALLAAIAFADALPDDLDLTLNLSAGMLSGEVEGRRVALGGPQRMVEKAGAVLALIAEGVPEGAEIDVVAPDRPAVRPPAASAEGQALDSESSDDGGG